MIRYPSRALLNAFETQCLYLTPHKPPVHTPEQDDVSWTRSPLLPHLCETSLGPSARLHCCSTRIMYKYSARVIFRMEPRAKRRLYCKQRTSIACYSVALSSAVISKARLYEVSIGLRDPFLLVRGRESRGIDPL